MVFTSIAFIYYFLPIVLLLYFITPKKYKNHTLLFLSMLFYFYGEPKYILLMIIEVLLSYYMTLLISKKKSKNLFILTITIHILLLCIFKYLDLFILTTNNIFNINLPLKNIALPIGISFYTFQILSYEIDVYKGKVEVEKSLIKLATYIFMFPQLIAGPIVKYKTIKKELDNRKVTYEDFSYAVTRFVVGLGKKVLISNTLGELCTTLINSTETSILLYWIYIISYTLQIYFDFSGYSDIALSLGRMFGFHFEENFNYPYTATSITSFWHRWHMTLSNWFKEYVYIPLGGNRKKTFITIRNILIVWFLTGLWHGASYNFILWGLYFGIILLIEKFIFSKYLKNTPRIIKRLYVVIVILISFVIFSSSSMEEIISILKGMFGLNKDVFINNYILYYLKSYSIILIISIIFTTPLVKNLINYLRKNKVLNNIINIFEVIFIFGVLILVTSFLIDSSYNPFLYFRF